MRVLLLNANPVVSRLMELAVSHRDIELEEVTHLSSISRLAYDAVFVDDGALDEENKALLQAIRTGRVVYLSGRETGEELGEAFDAVLKKPFLPSQVERVLDTLEPYVQEESGNASSSQDALQEVTHVEDEATEEEETNEAFFFYTDTQQNEPATDEAVLDADEVARIKALLEESESIEEEEIDHDDEAAYEARKVKAITENLEKEGLQIVEESDILESLTQEEKNEEVRMDAEELIALLRKIKPKKLRKLLKGATVTLRIDFKDA